MHMKQQKKLKSQILEPRSKVFEFVESELKNNIIEEIDNKDAKKSTIRNSEFQKAVCRMICFILLTACTYLYQAGGIENASVNDFINYIMAYIVPSLLSSGLYNNGSMIANTCVEKTTIQ
jgi:hypothetical protein